MTKITFSSKFISADQADEKRLWPKIEPILPMYRLFKADRPSTDEDHEAQDPMQHAVKIALEEQAAQLASIAEEVKQRGDGSSARMTHKREMENYIHSDIVREVFGVQIEIDDTMDVSTEISNIIRTGNPEGYRPDTVKKKLNKRCAPRMTMQLLHERDPEDEVLGWLRDISSIAQE